MRRATRPAEAHRSAISALDDEILALVVLARLVEVGVDELARHIGDAADFAGNRCPVDVDVKDIHEHRYPRNGARRGIAFKPAVAGQLARQLHLRD